MIETLFEQQAERERGIFPDEHELDRKFLRLYLHVSKIMDYAKITTAGDVNPIGVSAAIKDGFATLLSIGIDIGFDSEEQIEVIEESIENIYAHYGAGLPKFEQLNLIDLFSDLFEAIGQCSALRFEDCSTYDNLFALYSLVAHKLDHSVLNK